MLIEKVGKRLLRWQGHLLNKAGGLNLVTLKLSAIRTTSFQSSCFKHGLENKLTGSTDPSFGKEKRRQTKATALS